MNIEVNIINAFGINNQGGNPAGVVFDADVLTKEQMQEIASMTGFSETAFVSTSQIADFKLDFFTPVKQIAHCGHATIATFSYLKQIGKIKGNYSSKETIDGIRQIKFDGEQAFMEQQAPTFIIPPLNTVEEIIQSLNLRFGLIKKGTIPTIVNTGNSFLIIGVEDEAAMAQIKYDTKKVAQLSEKLQLIGFYIYTFSTSDQNSDVSTRMFAPFYGIAEEAATGMAAGPLAAYLFEFEKIRKTKFRIEQGRFMTNPSISQIIVELQLQENMISSLFAGGQAYVSGKKIIQL